jgi:hypothetical protein
VTTSTSCSRSPATPRDRRCHPRLKYFESSVGLSHKAFRLGKFAQSVNALLAHPALALLAYGGESVYYFVEQLVWAELLGYVDSVAINLEEVVKIESSIKKQMVEGCGDESEPVRAMRGRPQCGMRLSLLAGSRACPLRTSVAADPAARACRRRPRQRRAPCRHPWHKPSDPFRASVVTAVVFLRSVTKHDSNLIR